MMSRSSKIFVASFVCAAFLAIGIGCTVEEHDVEEANVFKCKSDNDCLDGSKCVKKKDGDDVIGSCVREDEINHCVDYDGDGFMYSDPQYDLECGYTSTNPKDPDDDDPLVYYGAPEICDGKDNNGDGCKDGTCPSNEDCKCPDVDGKPDYSCEKQNKCVEIVKPCWGGGSVDNYANSVCSAEKIGAEKCIDGKLVFVKLKNGKYVAEDGSCPTSTSEIPGYQDKEDCTTEVDDNCNTIVNEGCVSCKDDLAAVKDLVCYVTLAGVSDNKQDAGNLELVRSACSDKDKCPCIGAYACFSDTDKPKCAFEGAAITKESVGTDKCWTVFEN